MRKITDLPPQSNEPAPLYDPRLADKLTAIGNFDGHPWFRIVWGQDTATAMRYYAGRWHYKYMGKKTRELAWGEPEYDLAGQFSGYKHIYKREDVIPAGIILDQLIGEIQVGLPRFFIEIATYYDETEWDANRYSNHAGQYETANGQRIDFLGPYPDGGIDYEMIWLCASHDKCCDEVAESNNVGVTSDGKRCFGHRRLPNDADVQNMRARYRYFEKKRRAVTEKGNETEIARQTQHTLDAMEEHWQKFEARLADENYQVLLSRRKRLTSEGHGKDLERYVDMGGAVQKHEAEHGPLVIEK